MTTNLILSFKTSDGKTCNINIKQPRPDVTRAEALAVMEDIIDKDVFQTASGASLTGVLTVFTVVSNKNELLA